MTSNKYQQTGFTLVEMAIVLVILGFVLGALLLPLQAQRDQVALAQTRSTLETAKQALLGFAQRNGRLPCPATAASLGREFPLGGTDNTPPNPLTANCSAQSGFLPAATLGIEPVDTQGFALDAWNNRIRYAVTANNNSAAVVSGLPCGGDTAPDFTTTGNAAEVGLVCLAPNLRICRISPATDPANCSAAVNLINDAVVVIFSTGTTGAQVIGGADETENLNAAGVGQIDTVFVSHDITQTAPPNEFDHIVTWISPFVLYNAMIEAGQLH
jgi:prepilin-type N-terminal cleavage/methylation domain-containing protein